MGILAAGTGTISAHAGLGLWGFVAAVAVTAPLVPWVVLPNRESSDPRSSARVSTAQRSRRGLASQGHSLIVAYTVNRLGTWIGSIALMVAVYDHTHSTLAVAALLGAAQIVPVFLVRPLVANVESTNRRGGLSRLYLLEAATTGVLLLVVHDAFSLAGICALAAADGTFALAANSLLRASAARIARERAAPSVVEDAGGTEDWSGNSAPMRSATHDERADAAEQQVNATINVAFTFTFVTGPVLAGLVIVAQGATSGIAVNAFSFVAAAALLTRVGTYIPHPDSSSIEQRVRAGWRSIANNPVARAVIVAQSVSLVFFEAAGPVEVAYVKGSLGLGALGLGGLIAAWGAGVGIGSLVFARASPRMAVRLIAGGTVAIGLSYIGWTVAPSLAVALAAAVVGGIGNGVQYPAVISTVLRSTPASKRPTAMGVLESFGALAPVLALGLGGALGVLVGPRLALFVVGSGSIGSVFALVRVAALEVGDEPRPEISGGSKEPRRRGRSFRSTIARVTGQLERGLENAQPSRWASPSPLEPYAATKEAA